MMIKQVSIVMMIIFAMALVVTAGDSDGLHGSWDKLLQKHVKNGVVNYKGFQKDRIQLNRYLGKLEKEDISAYSREEKLAYWINAYNAFTVKLILDNYPVKSIRKISRPWKQRIWKASGKTVSLDDIEHKILRKEFNEPRIHFAIVCASIGCPSLQGFAFSPAKIEEQLSQSARVFFSAPKHFYIKEDGEKIIIFISKIFKWFGGDFGKNKAEKAAFMTPYLDKTSADKIRKAGSLKFKYLGYDWNLNEK
ncbi:MAG: DUF547 domain-containing protein [bacterium]|nr:DUF547 domain-containing protein [bacterium]